MTATVWAPLVAGVICVVVAIRELVYRQDHPHALGPSGELIALAVAGALVAFAVAKIAREWSEDEPRRRLEQERHAREYMEALQRGEQPPA